MMFAKKTLLRCCSFGVGVVFFLLSLLASKSSNDIKVEAFVSPLSHKSQYNRMINKSINGDSAIVLYANGQFRTKIKNLGRRVFRRTTKPSDQGTNGDGTTTVKESRDAVTQVAENEAKAEASTKPPDKESSLTNTKIEEAVAVTQDYDIDVDVDVDAPEISLSPEEYQRISSQVDSFLSTRKPQEALKVLQSTRYLNEDLFWRYVKVQYELSTQEPDEEAKEALLQRGLALANVGLQQDFESPQVRQNLSLCKALLLEQLDKAKK